MLTDRRRVLTLLAASFATPAFAQAPAMSRITAYAFSFAGLDGGRHQARRPRRQADPRRQHRLALRLHAAICRPAAALDALPRARADDRRRAVERFRRPGAGRRRRTSQKTAHGEYGVSFPLAAKVQRQGAERASVLQMGGDRAAARNAALELSQISRRPRWPYRRGVSDRHRADGRARHQRDRERASATGIRCSPQC